MSNHERILVIRYGALGDMIYCFQSYHEIRQAHANAVMTLLTAPAFAEFARTMPWFDHVIVDTHPSAYRPDMWLMQAWKLWKLRPTRVYELHGKLRQTLLFWLLGGPFGPKWSGAARYGSHPRLWPPQPNTHFKDFLASQLRLAGVLAQPPADLAWLDAPIDGFELPKRYAVLIPSSTPGQNYKRWPAEKYAAVAQQLIAQGLPVVVVGTKADRDALASFKTLVPTSIDLSGKTNLLQLAGVLRHSTLVIGNDTGPMHMAAALGVPTLALLSGRTDPTWSAPPEPQAQWLKQEPLSDLSVEKVLLALPSLLANNK